MTKFSFIKNIKLNKNHTVIKHMALLIALLMMFVMVVFAWFSLNAGEADADGLSIAMGASDTMLISLDGGENFVSGIDLLKPEDQQYISESNKIINSEGEFLLSMQDITSDGMTFYRPKFNETDGKSIPDTSENWDYATKNRAYISQDIVFRTDDPCNIYMGSGTKITTFSENEKKKLVSDNSNEIGNKSSAGNFSNDCIVGALRISAIDTSAQGNPCRFVCIPRSDIELVRNGDAVTVHTGSAVSDDTSIHSYYDSSYQTTGAPVDSYDAITGFDGSQLITTTLNEVVRDGKIGYEGTATINIWLEGCDPEVTRLLSGGKYNITFDFIASDVN
ncbi:MAG: hypothetical protein E7566_03020 [Ruminococcaceae bacterium]|nr:hypothetical protein [Oscillospiraceae bacterium]